MHINLPDKLYYKIGEIAKAFDVNTSLIRFWEKEFKVLRPKKNKHGNRIYTKKDIEKLKQIYFLLKEKGYTIEGARQKLKGEVDINAPETGSKNLQIVNKLQDIKQELLKIKIAIQE